MMREHSHWSIAALLASLALAACGEEASGDDMNALAGTAGSMTPTGAASAPGGGALPPAAGSGAQPQPSAGVATPPAPQAPAAPAVDPMPAPTMAAAPVPPAPVTPDPTPALETPDDTAMLPPNPADGMMPVDPVMEPPVDENTDPIMAPDPTGMDNMGDMGAGDEMPPEEMPEELSLAMQLYAGLCVECHGESGEGVEGLGPEIQHPVRDFGDYLVRNGSERPQYQDPMPAIGAEAVSDEVLAEIWDFLDSQPRPTDGAGLYADFCRNCHGDDGNAVPNHGITGMRANADEYIRNVRGGHHAGEFGNRNGYMPAWTADALSDAEITMIAEYVAGF